jgi:MFS transporter, DHA3 family, macrolide efflux protein
MKEPLPNEAAVLGEGGGAALEAAGIAPPPATHGGMRIFAVVWLGQMVSMIGTSLSGFALGVWVFQETGSITQYALVNCVTLLPSVVVSPLAGALVDRWDRRRAMFISDLGAGLGTLIMVALILTGHLRVWTAVLVVANSSIMGSLRGPAYSAAATQLVPPEHLGRAAGMVQLGGGVAQIIAPSLAGVLMMSVGLRGVLFIDLGSFVFALLTLAVVRFPGSKQAGPEAPVRSLRHDAIVGWSYIKGNAALAALLVFSAVSSFCVGTVEMLSTPMVLGFANAATLGLALSIGGFGMLFGSLCMVAWGGPRRLVHGVLGFGLLQGLMAFVAGLRPSALLFGIGAFGFLLATPLIGGCTETIWMRAVPLEMQGRVFATRNMVVGATMSLTFLAVGPIADHVFEPLLVAGGPLAASLGGVLGTGPGRGIGLFFLIIGALMVALVVAGALYPPLSRLPVQARSPSDEEREKAAA